jgi:hypothetical protein
MILNMTRVTMIAALLASVGLAAEPKDKYDRAGDATSKAVDKAGNVANSGIDAAGKGVGAVVEHGGRGAENAAKNTGHAAAVAGGAIKDFFTEDLSAKNNEENVRLAQGKLKDEGLYDGPVDGVAGARTKSALRTYQQKHGLDASGKVDSKTAKSLGID